MAHTSYILGPICMHTGTCACAYNVPSGHTHTRIYRMAIYTHAYIHIHIHAYIHTHVYTYTYI